MSTALTPHGGRKSTSIPNESSLMQTEKRAVSHLVIPQLVPLFQPSKPQQQLLHMRHSRNSRRCHPKWCQSCRFNHCHRRRHLHLHRLRHRRQHRGRFHHRFHRHLFAHLESPMLYFKQLSHRCGLLHHHRHRHHHHHPLHCNLHPRHHHHQVHFSSRVMVAVLTRRRSRFCRFMAKTCVPSAFASAEWKERRTSTTSLSRKVLMIQLPLRSEGGLSPT